MTRSFDTIPDEADRSAEYSKPSSSVMSVCPFCGAISEKNDAPCPRCKMENSALTRQATRARVGPWYVMQSRNPSAPGMKCNTLLALIRKGQITPRSVIRGPTTFQLWRFAARVKGISKEFGLCYSCGAEVQRTSTFCARCSRSQELPPNPDVLLENEPQSKTVYRQVNPRPESPPAQAQETLRVTPQVEPEPDRPARSGPQIPSAAETMAELADIPSPHNAPTELQSRPRQRPQEGVLTPRELAAAFSLQYDPTMDGSASQVRRGGGKNIAFAAILILLLGGGVSLFYFVPMLRQRFVAFLQGSVTPSAAAVESPSTARPSVPDRTPDWMMTVPTDKPITSPAKSPAPNTSPASNATASTSDLPAPSPAPVAKAENTPAPQDNAGRGKAPVAVPATSVRQPVPQAASPMVATNTNPPLPTPAFDNPVTTSTPVDPGMSQAASTTSKLRKAAGNDLDDLAMELRSNGLDAEHRRDYVAAQYYYQQVETLPHDSWPGDIEPLLKNVQKHIQSGR